MKKAAKVLLLVVLTLLLIWLSGRYCWKIFGFALCESAGIEQVSVEDGHVRIRGFDPGSFPRGFLGCHGEQEGSTLYVGFKFSTLFGIFETGDFEVTVPTKGRVTQVIIRTSENEYPIWPKEVPEEPEIFDETAATENGIYVSVERDDVYSVGWYFENESGGMCNADGTALEMSGSIRLDNDVYFAAANLERPVPVTLVFSDKDGKTIAQAHLSYDPQSPVMNVVLTADGRILVNGVEVEKPAVPTAYEEILGQYRLALEESWNGQRLVDEGLNLMILDVAPGTVGYAVDDLDDDGIPELAIGTMSGDEFYGKLIFELYTLDADGQSVQVFSSIHRDRYYYAGGIRFANMGSSGADSSYVTTLKLENGELIDMTYTTDPGEYVQMELMSVWEEDPEAVYIGEYLDYDNNEPNLEIAKGEDGTYIVQIGIFRLTTLSDGIGELTPEGMLFTATDAAGNPISGIITVADQIATVTFTDSTWPLIENGAVYQYSKSSGTPHLWSEQAQ